MGGLELHNYLLDKVIEFHNKNPQFEACFFLNRDGEIETRLTLDRLLDTAQTVALGMKAKGLRPGDRVLLSVPTSEDLVIAFFALWWIGGIPVPTPEATMAAKKGALSERFGSIISDCSPIA